MQAAFVLLTLIHPVQIQPNQLGQRIHPQLVKQGGAVGFDGAAREVELGPDFAARQPFGDQLEHLMFAL